MEGVEPRGSNETAHEYNDRVKRETPKARGWPDGVEPVGLDDLNKLGVHRETKQLHWNGAPIVTKHELGRREYFLAQLVAGAAVATAVFAAIDLILQILAD